MKSDDNEEEEEPVTEHRRLQDTDHTKNKEEDEVNEWKRSERGFIRLNEDDLPRTCLTA